MNVLALLDQELKDKNWSLDEKIRYLYLRSCELFSYDPRYFLCSLFEDGREIRDEILNKEIALENLEMTWVVCTSYSKAFKRLVKELLNKESSIAGIVHKYVVLENKNSLKVVADGTYGYDFTRVKMGLSTYGYYPLCSIMNTFSRDILSSDLKLGYIQKEYGDITIQNYENAIYSSLSTDKNTFFFKSDEFLIMRMKEIKRLYDTYTNMTQFYDLQHCASYLQKHILREDYEKVGEVELVQRSKNMWDFMTIFPVELKDDMLYYALKKDADQYVYQEISKSDAIYYINNMQGKNKELIYHK